MTLIRRLPKAQEDLLDIWCHIGCDNPNQADRYLDFLEEKLKLLATIPGMGRLHNDLGPGLRVFPVDDYLIFYRQSVEGIDVVRVLHGARDIESLFRDDHP
jgi:toxin ParE1/3/4